MSGERIAIFGLGRSGLAIGRAALWHGAIPTIYDEKPGEAVPKPELVDEARSTGIELNLGWSGDFAKLKPQPRRIVVNPAIDHRHPKLRNAMAAGIEVISEVEFAFRIAKAPIVAITGTNGKSTTTVMTYLCLRECGHDPILCGNIFGSGFPEMPLTEAALEANENQVLVAEISSFQLEWVRDFRPVSAGITNIAPDHLDRYDSFEDYAVTKGRIFEAQADGDTAVLRSGDPVAQFRNRPGVRQTTFGGGDFTIDLPFAEPHNLLNAEMAAQLSLGYLRTKPDFSERKALEDIARGLRLFSGLAHRMERLGERNGVTVINNSMCTNPEAVRKSLQGLQEPAHVLIGGVNKGLDFAPLREFFSTSPHSVYLYGRDAVEIQTELGGIGTVFVKMQEAFTKAVDIAIPGECIILAPGCASTDQFRDFIDRGNVFRTIAKEWLRS